MARSAKCQCQSNFTCGHCLREAKPWHWTLKDGSGLYGPFAEGHEQTKEGGSKWQT